MQETAFWVYFPEKFQGTKDFYKSGLRISFKRESKRYERLNIQKTLEIRKINYKRGEAALEKGSLFA